MKRSDKPFHRPTDADDLELHPLVRQQLALEEAWRCLQCADPPCQKGCPASVPVKLFIRQLRNKDFRGAAVTIRLANPFGGSCGRVCAQAEQCQHDCTRASIDRPIDIAMLQRFACDHELSAGAVLPHVLPATGKRVAVIGAGPAGLSAAAELARLGHAVEVFEKASRPGGLLDGGIPPQRLPRQVVEHEVEAVRSAGVVIHTGRKIGSVAELRPRFDGVVVAVGLCRPRRLGIKGEDADGVYQALEFLDASARGEPPELGGRVLV
ncbi:MAG: FAD-binding protein, partial [Deltaproteobacteria bacterium]